MGKTRPTRRKLAQFFNYRIRIQCFDRVWTGILMGVDRHLNLVLHKAEETRYYKIRGEPQLKEVKRVIGLIVLRGCEILSVTPEQHLPERHVYVKAVEVKSSKKAGNQKQVSAKAAMPTTTAPAPNAMLNPLLQGGQQMHAASRMPVPMQQMPMNPSLGQSVQASMQAGPMNPAQMMSMMKGMNQMQQMNAMNMGKGGAGMGMGTMHLPGGGMSHMPPGMPGGGYGGGKM